MKRLSIDSCLARCEAKMPPPQRSNGGSRRIFGPTFSTRGDTPVPILGLMTVILLRLSRVGASPVERGAGRRECGGGTMGVRGGSAWSEG